MSRGQMKTKRGAPCLGDERDAAGLPSADATGTELDGVRQRLALMEEFLAWRRLVERSREQDDSRAARPAGITDGSGSLEALATEDSSTSLNEAKKLNDADRQNEAEWMRWARRAQRALVSHPVATQAAFVALAREGRAFAATEEGRVWARVLEGAPAVQRLRTLWEAANFTITADEGEAPLPSAMIELFVRAAAAGNIDELAARLGMPFLDLSASPLQEPSEPAE